MEVHELITNAANVNLAQVQRRTLNGRKYLVGDSTLIVPGVLDGSKGALMYPPEVIQRNPIDWNSIPIVVYHPTVNGVNVSARSPEILEEHGIGLVFNGRYENKLVSELWFDEELTTNYDRKLATEHKIIPRLLKGKAIELSTGMMTTHVPMQGTYNGKKYTHIVTGYRPDHLAVLPDQIGACSLIDGCGVLVNTTTNTTNNTESNNDNTNNGGQSSDSSLKKGNDMALTQDQRKELVTHITANCDCWKGDEATLNGFSDDKLKAWKDRADREKESAVVVNSTKEAFKKVHGREPTANEMPAFIKEKAKKKVKPKKVESQDDESKSGSSTNNSANTQQAKPMTLDDMLKKASPEDQAVWNNAKQLVADEKKRIIESLTNNISNSNLKSQAVKTYEKMLLDDLRTLIPTISQQSTNNNQSNTIPLFTGNTGSSNQQTNNSQFTKEDQDDILTIPTVNWEEEAKSQKRKSS